MKHNGEAIFRIEGRVSFHIISYSVIGGRLLFGSTPRFTGSPAMQFR